MKRGFPRYLTVTLVPSAMADRSTSIVETASTSAAGAHVERRPTTAFFATAAYPTPAVPTTKYIYDLFSFSSGDRGFL